jgi:hypothetical protein
MTRATPSAVPASQAAESAPSNVAVNPQRRNFIFVAILLGMLMAALVDFITTLIWEWVVDKLTRSPSFEGRPDRVQVQAALDRIAHRIVAQRDWHEERRELAEAQTQRLPVPVPAGGVPSRHEPNRTIR